MNRLKDNVFCPIFDRLDWGIIMDGSQPASTTTNAALRDGGSWRRRIWKGITMPWFSSLLEQVILCRVLLATVAILGGAHLLGWSLWPCFFASATGLPCPGCGMTRSVTALLKGQWGLAMWYHPFSPGFVVMAALLTWAAMTPKVWREPVVRWVKTVERRTCLPLLFLVCAFIYGLIRMAVPSTNPPIVSSSPVRAWLQERIKDRTD